jgi:hypothetical protein
VGLVENIHSWKEAAMKMQAIAITILTVLAGSVCAADTTTTDQAGFGPGQGRGGQMGQFREKLRQKILAKFDFNHDGKLEPNELAAAKAAIQKWRENHKGQGQGLGARQRRQPGAQQQDSAPQANDNPNATKVNVQKAIEEDTKPEQVGF